jgi:hypothetical protein
MAKLKYTITMIREVAQQDFEVNSDEELLKKVKEYADEDCSFICNDVMGISTDKIDIELVK